MTGNVPAKKPRVIPRVEPMASGDCLPEPVRRDLAHAVPSGEAGAPGVRMTMSRRITVGDLAPVQRHAAV